MKLLRRLLALLRDLPETECSRHAAWLKLNGGAESRKWGYVDALGQAERRRRYAAAGRPNVSTDSEACIQPHPKASL
jgi:hypothetical protein